MRIIFSKNRAAQLDLLLRSLRKHAPHEATRVLWWADDWTTLGRFWEGYIKLPLDQFLMAGDDFDLVLRRVLMECPDETVTFFCDDDVVFDDVPFSNIVFYDEEILCVSLRLGAPKKSNLRDGVADWNWVELPRTDHGFPGSIDGHTFRVDDIWEMIGESHISDPTELETVLAMRCEHFAERRPLMASFAEQKLVGVPVNRVADRSGCPNGETFPQSAEELNKRFLDGQRIDLDRLDFSGVAGCHHEIEFQWK